MDIREIILKEIRKKKELRTSEIAGKTGFSRTYIHRLLKELVDQGIIVLVGKANKARYIPFESVKSIKNREKANIFEQNILNDNLYEDIILKRIEEQTKIFENLSKNIQSIINYSFTEMLNNAIEHSRSKYIKIKIRKENATVHFFIGDNGIGIFNNLMIKNNLNNELESIQLLLKGKQTTAPENHSGEGIYFTSKVLDHFTIKGSGKKIIFDNIINETFISNIKPVIGTKIEGILSLSSKRNLQNIFEKYSSESFRFDKTILHVDIYKLSKEPVSRSLARRVLTGLDEFKEITLDFKNVDGIGQGFADEIFRVWKNQHPQVNIFHVNANDNIEFMISHVQTNAIVEL